MHTMPRKDRTFTGIDLVRLWARNSDPNEQKDLLVVMVVAIGIGTARQTRSKLLLLIVQIATFFIPRPFNQILRILLRFFRVVSFEEEARAFIERAERVLEDADLTLGDVNRIIDQTEDL